MKLTELEPRWIERDGQRVSFAFRCPGCRQMWLTCTIVALRLDEQMELLAAQFREAEGQIVCCKVLAWGCKGDPDFNALQISPSLDASASGHWHGWIGTNCRPGEVSDAGTAACRRH